MWCRTVNPRGGAGNNIPADLYLEHPNRTLKDCLHSLGPNISIQSIVQSSKSLNKLLDIGSYFDKVCKIRPVSMHHTSPSPKEDRDKIISQLATESRVFDYIPGRFHHTFKSIQPHISSHLNVDTLTTWVKQTKQNIVNPRGGAGNNIPADLYLEHPNRTLKDCLHSLGPNISIQSIVQSSKSLNKLLDIGSYFDKVCKIRPVSMHHTSPSPKEDRDKIISQLATESRVFDYIPGRFHHTFKSIQPHISSHLNVDTLTTWVKQTKQNIVKHHMLNKYCKSNH